MLSNANNASTYTPKGLPFGNDSCSDYQNPSGVDGMMDNRVNDTYNNSTSISLMVCFTGFGSFGSSGSGK